MKKTLTQFFSSRLFVRVASLLFLFALIPLVVVSGLFYRQLNASISDTIQNGYREIVRGYSVRVERYLEEPYVIMKSHIELLQTISRDQERLQLALMKVSLSFPIIKMIVMTDTAGIVVAHSEVTNDTTFQPEDHCVEQALSGVESFSSVHVNNDFVPYIDMALPYRIDGRIAGAIVSRIDLMGIWDLIDSIRIGNTGRAFVCTGDGRVIAHWDKAKVVQEYSLATEHFFSALIAEKEGCREYYDTERRHNVVLSFAFSRRFEWYFGIVQDAREVYQFRDIAVTYYLIAVGAVVITALLGSFLIARRITRPLIDMTRAMRRVARGVYDVSIPPRSKDEIGRLTISFNRMVEKLRRADANERLAVFGQAAAGIAHKMKNAMVSIKTLAQLLEKRKSDAQASAKLSGELQREVTYVESVLSRFSSFKMSDDSVVEVVDLSIVVQEVLKSHEQIIAEKGVRVAMTLPQERICVRIDRDALREVLTNIIRNACDAMSSGGTLSVSIASETVVKQGSHTHRHGVVRIGDTGSGIEPANVSKLFTPFFTTKKFGMGIGLAHCKRLLLRYHGDIGITSEVNVGTTVLIEVPLVTAVG